MQEDEKGFFTMRKILGFHGLVVGTNLAQERAPVVLKALLEKNHKENDLDPNDKGLVEENQAVPELNKYFYIHRVQKESVASTKKTQMDLSADNLKIANLKNALENTAPPSIKVENPEYQELMRRKAVLATGKGKVEKELGTVRDYYAEIKGLNKASYKEVQDECSNHETQASEFLQKCRDTLGAVSSVAKDDVQGCLDLKGTVEELIPFAVIHFDGLKAFKARQKALLNK